MAKCGVFTHVRELALYMQKRGVTPIIGFIHNPKTISLFKITKKDMDGLIESIKGLEYFYYDSDESLLKKIQSNKFDLVHAHSPIVLSSAMAIYKKYNTPYIVTLHGTANWNTLHGASLRTAKDIIAIGPEVAASAGSEFKDRIEVIFNGIDTDHYKPNNMKNNHGPLRILWMGRTNGPTANGVTYLSKAIRQLRRKGIPVEAKVIGHASGAGTGELELCGWVHEPLKYLQWSQIVFGRGRALREAMAAGNVGFLIGQGYGGVVMENWFDEGKTPLLSASLKHGYSKLNSQDIMKDLLDFHYRRGLLEERRLVARKIAEDHFNIWKMVDETFKIYQKALQG